MRAAVIARRKQVAEEKKARGEEWKDRKLVVSRLWRCCVVCADRKADLDFGAEEGASYGVAVRAVGIQGRAEAADERNQPVSALVLAEVRC